MSAAPAAGPGTPVIAVCGSQQADVALTDLAREVGAEIADAGAVLVCGGLGGVMAGACEGARSRGGIAVGLLPGQDRALANEHVTVAIGTGIGELRNALIVRTADAVVAVGGEWGTLSEVAFAVKAEKPVVAVAPSDLIDGVRERGGIELARSPGAAVARALELARAAG